MEGILKADRNGSLNENAISEAVEGDIILFRDENGDINHSAINNKNGTAKDLRVTQFLSL
jgi:hypothetical protein